MCVSESQRDVEWVEDSLCHVEPVSSVGDEEGGNWTIAAQCDREELQPLSKHSISAGASAALQPGHMHFVHKSW